MTVAFILFLDIRLFHGLRRHTRFRRRHLADRVVCHGLVLRRLFEAFWNGQTPGKHMLRLRVVSDEGQPINGLQAVLRNLLRAADAQPRSSFQPIC